MLIHVNFPAGARRRIKHSSQTNKNFSAYEIASWRARAHYVARSKVPGIALVGRRELIHFNINLWCNRRNWGRLMAIESRDRSQCLMIKVQRNGFSRSGGPSASDGCCKSWILHSVLYCKSCSFQLNVKAGGDCRRWRRDILIKKLMSP